MKLIVQKYGGKSLKSPQKIHAVAERIKAKTNAGFSLVVVVSAMGQMTNHLIRLAKRVVRIPQQRELDMLVTVGERISMSLLAMALEERGVNAISLTGSQSGIITTNNHTDARITEIRPSRILNELNNGKVVIVAGFQGVSEKKEVTTLGRGGSDTTAVAIAAELKALKCEILTDVSGLFTADPKLVKTAKLISYCNYDLCLELSRLGAKMHPRSIALAKKYKVPLTISSSMEINGTGTSVNDFKYEGKMEKSKVTAITYSDNFICCSSNISEFINVIKHHFLPISMISTFNNEIRFLSPKDKLDAIEKAFSSSNVKIFSDICLVSAASEDLIDSSEILLKFLEIIGSASPVFISSNAVSISAAINKNDKERMVNLLHKEFIDKNHS